KSAMEALEQAAMAMGQAAYAQQQSAAGPDMSGMGGPYTEPTDGGTAADDEDVVEGEFREA
ncbi:MAG: hypothetical protein KDD73_13610, partial [Anaerolineales bacterium]|nr:hypothetical protein [Anaerolineales bacterium]